MYNESVLLLISKKTVKSFSFFGLGKDPNASVSLHTYFGFLNIVIF